jgi:hypothetical protein
MRDSEEAILKNFFSWENRDVVLRIRFNDLEELEMTVGGWAEDLGEPPHVHGTIVRTIKSSRDWKSGSAVMFQLRDIQSIVNSDTQEIIFELATK